MRKSRTKIRKENQGNKYIFIFLFIIILPIISIVPGYISSKYLIIPSLFSEVKPAVNDLNEKKDNDIIPGPSLDEETVTEEETSDVVYQYTAEIKGFDFYSIQLGSFATEANASELVKELEQKKMGSFIYEKDGFKVVTLSLMEREQIDALMSSIKTSYEGSFVVATSIPNHKIEYTTEESDYIELINNGNDKLINSLKTLSDSTFDLDSGSITVQEYKSILNNTKKDLTEITNSLATIDNPSRFESLNGNFSKLLNSISESINVPINEPDENLKVAGKNFINTSLYQYLEFSRSVL